jgi:hypothetical protein
VEEATEQQQQQQQQAVEGDQGEDGVAVQVKVLIALRFF